MSASSPPAADFAERPIARRTDRYVETEIDGENVIMELETGDFFSLADSALAIWALIDGTRNRAAILRQLAADFAADPATIAPDLDAFLADLAAAGLVESA